IPDDPTAAAEPKLLLENQFQLGRVLVADGQPKRAGRLQDTLHLPTPRSRPVEVFVRVAAVVVHVVVVTDVERRVGEGQVHYAGFDLLQTLNAITLHD